MSNTDQILGLAEFISSKEDDVRQIVAKTAEEHRVLGKGATSGSSWKKECVGRGMRAASQSPKGVTEEQRLVWGGWVGMALAYCPTALISVSRIWSL